jgi:hypothetical protein
VHCGDELPADHPKLSDVCPECKEVEKWLIGWNRFIGQAAHASKELGFCLGVVGVWAVGVLGMLALAALYLWFKGELRIH